MKTSLVFSLAYLAGTVAGIIGGHRLAWWQSGAIAWACAGNLLACHLMQCTNGLVMPWRRGWACKPFVFIIRARWDRRYSISAVGLFWGALAGAAAVDASEVLDALVWPGHEVDASILALLVALAWLVGVVTDKDADERFRPAVAGFGLYLFTVALAVFPAVWEVL